MKTLSASNRSPGTAPNMRFEAARALAFSLAESDSQMLEPELVAWIDRSSRKTSPVLEGCGGFDGWHDYGVSHGGRVEVDVGEVASFIFAESSPFDSYEHLGPGPYLNLYDSDGNEMICLAGGKECAPLDEWTSKLT